MTAISSKSWVSRVYYPAHNGNRPPGQMHSGGAIVSLDVTGDPHAVISAVRLFTPATSLGGVDSLIHHPASSSHHIVDPKQRNATGVSYQMLRLSIGLEDVDDLWQDLDAALSRA